MCLSLISTDASTTLILSETIIFNVFNIIATKSLFSMLLFNTTDDEVIFHVLIVLINFEVWIVKCLM